MDNLSAKIADEGMWSTTEPPLTPEEEDTIVTLVVVIVGILAAIIFLFSMGLFIDCKTRKNETVTGKRKRLRLKMPPLGGAHRHHHQRFKREDSKYLAADMCPNGSSEYASTGRSEQPIATTSIDAIV